MTTGVIFDLDGTLLDTLEDLYLSVNHVLRTYGCPERTRQEIRAFVGNGARNLIARSLPEGSDLPLDGVLSDYQAYYDRLSIRGHTCPYPGIPAQLEALAAKYPVAIVSNKPDISVGPLCQKFFPGIYALGSSDDRPRKPQPDMVNYAMERIGADRCIYVGDSEVDVLTAANSGCPCLTVLWGFRDRPELERAGALHLCDRVEKLLPMLDEMIAAQTL